MCQSCQFLKKKKKKKTKIKSSTIRFFIFFIFFNNLKYCFFSQFDYFGFDVIILFLFFLHNKLKTYYMIVGLKSKQKFYSYKYIYIHIVLLLKFAKLIMSIMCWMEFMIYVMVSGTHLLFHISMFSIFKIGKFFHSKLII